MPDRIFSDVGWMTAGIGISAIIGFLFQILMGNYLETRDFTALVAIMGILSLFSLPLGVFESETAAIISKNVSSDFIDVGRNVRHFSPGSGGFFALFSVGSISMVAVFSPRQIISSADVFLSFGLIIVVLTMLRVRLGVFQGVKRFRTLAISHIVNSAVKLCSGVVLVWFGLGLRAGVIAILLGMIATVLLLFFMKSRISGMQSNTEYLTTELENRWGIIWMLIFVGIMLNWDVVIANSSLAPEEAGLYSYSAVLAKSVVIASTAVIGVLVPNISGAMTNEGRSSTFFRLNVVYISMALPIIIVAFLFESRVLSVVFYNSEALLYEGPLANIAVCYTLLSLAQISIFSSIARLEQKNKLLKLSPTLLIPIVCYLFVETVEDLTLYVLFYSLAVLSISLIDEIIALRGSDKNRVTISTDGAL